MTATDSSCALSVASLPAGRHAVSVANTGTKTTEVYVYAAGDKIVGEAEDIGPGTKRTFRITVRPGSYQVACKPGQTGAGLRTALTVTG